jgi:hypothetical protein
MKNCIKHLLVRRELMKGEVSFLWRMSVQGIPTNLEGKFTYISEL